MGGSGGGSSGPADWPTYMKYSHAMFMGPGTLSKNVTMLTQEALDNNPYENMVFYNPATELAYMDKYGCHYLQYIESLDPSTDWQAYFANARDTILPLATSPYVDDIVSAHATNVEKNLEYKILPKYRRGMQNIGAVMTSAYKLGEAWLWKEYQDEIAEFDKDLRYKTYQACLAMIADGVQGMLQIFGQITEGEKQALHYGLEAERMTIEATNTYYELKNSALTGAALWPLEATKYFNDVMRSISGGGAATENAAKKNPVIGALGGALSGAAMGASIGSAVPGIGTAIGAAGGAIVGAVGGYLA